jgi:hypothetical protein
MSQGGNANINGARLEKRVEYLLDIARIIYNKQHKYTSIYGHNAQMDFYIPALDLAIECKNQEGAGSVAEKIPYVMEAFLQHPAKNGLLIFGGSYWATKPGIKAWAESRAKQSGKNIQIIYEQDLESWLEQTSSRKAA